MNDNIMTKHLEVEMPDGSVWRIAVAIIAGDRARYYAREYDGTVQTSLTEDTLPLFRNDDFEIIDWATGNMNWEDVKPHAQKVKAPRNADYADGWVNGKKKIV